MIDRLSEPINQKKGKIFQQRGLLVILGIVLVLLSIEGVFLVLVRNKNKGSKVENQEKVEVSEEKITPVPTVAESAWKDKETTLIKGKVSSFDIDGRKINLVLEDNTTRTLEIDDKTIFIDARINKKQVSPIQSKIIDVSTFWKGLEKDDRISCSCYKDSNLAAFITKEIVE